MWSGQHRLAEKAMKHPGPIRREPTPPEKSGVLTILLPVGAMVLGLGAVAYCLRDAGVISSQSLLIIMVLLLTIGACIFMVLDSDRATRRPRLRRDDEVPPPFDLYLVWPPPGGLPPDADPTSPPDDKAPPEGSRR